MVYTMPKEKLQRIFFGVFYWFVVSWISTSTEHKGSSFDGLCLRWYPCLQREHSI